jgi:phosphoadenosine phosphosulfate reductase
MTEMLSSELQIRLDRVRTLLSEHLAAAPGAQDVCLTCSFQAEDVLLLKLALELRPEVPVLFLDTGYHFAETYAYRDQIAASWRVNLTNLLPAQTVAGQEAEHGLLYQASPDRCCGLRKVEPLFRAVAQYKVWITGLRREQAKSRATLEEVASFTLPAGQQVLKLSPLADWTTRDIWYACQHFEIPLLPLYDKGYSSIGCEPCTSLPLDPNDPRSGRWSGRKVECGIHIEAAPARSPIDS